MSGGQIAGGVIGFVAGMVYGGGPFTPSGWIMGARGAMMGYMAGGMLDPPQGPSAEGPRLQDLKIQSSEYGRPLPRIWGKIGIAGTVIWASDIVEVSSTESQGGKGGGGGSDVTTFSYYGNFAIAICQGPEDGSGMGAVTRMWAGPEKRLIYRAGFSGDNIELEGGTIRIYLGTDTQMPDPLIESYLGVGNAPAFRYTCYAVFEMFPLHKDGNRLPFILSEVVSKAEIGYEYWYFAVFGSTMVYDSDRNSFWMIVDSDPGKLFEFSISSGSIVSNYTIEADVNIYSGVNIVYDPFKRVIWYGYDVGGQIIGRNTSDGTIYSTFNLDTEYGFNDYYSLRMVGNTVWVGDSGYGEFFKLDPESHTIAHYDIHMETTFGYDFVYNPDMDEVWAAGYLVGSDSGITRINPYTGGFIGFIDLPTYNFEHIRYNPIRQEVYVTHASGQYVIDSTTGIYLANRTWDPATITLEVNPIDGTIWHSAGDASTAATTGLLVNDDPDDNTPIGSYDVNVAPITIRFDNDGYVWILSNPEVVPANDDDWHFCLKQIDPSNGDVIQFYTINPSELFYSEGTVSLSEIIAELSDYCDFTPDQYNVSQLTDSPVNYVVGRQTSVRATIEALAPVYYFDAVQSSGVAKFVKRGGAIALTIPDEDLAAHVYGDEPPDPLFKIRKMKDELPGKVNVSYMSLATNYDTASKAATRQVNAPKSEASMDLSMVLTDQKGQEVADVTMYLTSTSQISYSFSLSRKYSELEPTDNVLVKGIPIRIVKKAQTVAGVLQFEGFREDISGYIPNSIVTETPVIVQTVAVIGETRNEFLDLPLLRDIDNDSGFYDAATGYQAGWNGSVIFKSVDGGSSYSNVLAIPNSRSATIGDSVNALGNPDNYYMLDLENELIVSLTDSEEHTLSSTTYVGLLNGLNAYALKSGNKWEIGQFQDAIQDGDGNWHLTRLFRGRRGTEHAMYDHDIGDTFVLLNSATINRVPMSSSELALARLYKAVTIGDTLINTEEESFTGNGEALKCYSPVLGGGGRASSGDILIKWQRRGRIGASWTGFSAPLSEESELYDVEIYDDSDYTTLIRTISGITTTETTYTSAQQVTDFGSNQSEIFFKVYQISGVVGRGYPLEAQV